MKIHHVSDNKLMIFLARIEIYMVILFGLFGVGMFLLPRLVLILFIGFCVITTLGSFSYIAPFLFYTKQYKYSLQFENNEVQLMEDNRLITRFNEINSVTIKASEYRGKPQLLSFYNSAGINKITIKTEIKKNRFVFKINSKKEVEKLRKDIDKLQNNLAYKIVAK